MQYHTLPDSERPIEFIMEKVLKNKINLLLGYILIIANSIEGVFPKGG